MIRETLSAFGGIGMFLVGMLLLTSGLKGLAGGQTRALLVRFTRTPLSGAITGALTTAVVQSSSVTTVAAVGFVASGMLTFSQALGIIFGANIGTTITGWLVATLGFKLDLGELALPLILAGALLQLSGRARLVLLGQAVTGFSLLFVGIDYLKDGLAAFSGVLTPSDFPPDTIIGRLELVAIGIAITLVTQSSSAGVATALAALGAGAINFPQAAALVIGMNVGTTFTALLATVGGGTMARRTGLAHVLFNLMTGLIAFFLLGPFTAVAAPWIAEGSGQIALVGFHSFFNGAGVALMLPVTRQFARLVEWLVPERGSPLTRGLDPAVLGVPNIAAELAVATLARLNTAVCDHLCRSLGADLPPDARLPARAEIEAALIELRDYLDRIRLPADRPDLAATVAECFHALDHLLRLLYRCDQRRRISALGDTPRLRRLRGLIVSAAARQARSPDDPATEEMLDRLRRLLHDQRKHPRDRIVEDAVFGRISDEIALARLDALRWLHRVAYHLWRIRLHQNAIATPRTEAVPQEKETRVDVALD
ncbi:Na/Pi cotransporter family protein [Celeribacter indicus]|uniref:Na/Pi-cotransporter II-like protein n=1 Tax=Celeribacter indicus TaxID=1208324 RepID=A0A0B5E5X1_9RHOB|nr:Na/Pi symporter [Celeribacter indicus]AJE48421.1 Na/Pi-cotransporter II-like protein [Celeribacter indicus]SDX29734.1 phosphate:Na+ symporter [Celeribacter indicus]